MTQDEKLLLVFGYFGSVIGDKKYRQPDGAIPGSAGYVPGIPRLGIPPQWQTDAGIGVASQWESPVKRGRTALPSGLALAASWNPDIARAGGAMIGSEARSSGFNVMLAGGVNLLREPRNGRNFEYGGEDPRLRRHDHRGGNRGRPVEPYHLDDQAFRAERSGNRPQQRQFGDRPGGGAHVRPAGFPVRDGGVGPRRGDVRLQPRQRSLVVRKPVSAHRRAAPGLGLQGLCHVRLGRYAFDCRRRQCGARPGIGLSLRRAALFRRSAQTGGGARRRFAGAARPDGDAHPPLDVRARPVRPSGCRTSDRFRRSCRRHAPRRGGRGGPAEE